MIEPSSVTEQQRKDFLAQQESKKTSHPGSDSNIQLHGLDEYLSDEDYVEIERSGSDIPEEDKTVTTVQPGSQQEQNMKDFLFQKDKALVKRALAHQKEESFV